MRYESGNTPLIRNDELSKFFGAYVLVKDESKNPFGTFKDRRSELAVKRAAEECVDTLVLITSGNAGYSLEKFSEGTGIRIVNIVGRNVCRPTKDRLKEHGEVVEIDLSRKMLEPEDAIALARQNDKEAIWDVSNGLHEAYEKIIEEIRQEDPDFVVLPVGSGEAFVGCYNGIKKNGMKAKLVGVGVKNRRYSVANSLYTPWTPYEPKMRAITRERHKIIRLEEGEIKEAYKRYNDKFDVEPSSAVIFAALPKLKFGRNDKIILVNSGKGLV